jgi:chromosome segregation ATPase
MNNVGKILVVIIAVASLSFMGFAVVTTVGGYNFEEHIARVNDRYRITNSGGEEPVWNSVQVIGEENVNENPSLPAVLDATYADAIADMNAEINAYKAEEEAHAAFIAQVTAANEADALALSERADQLRADLEALRVETEAIGQRVQTTQDEVLKQQARLAARREDVFRLQAQYEEIAVDEERAREIIVQLTELIHQIDGDLERARRRETQLVEQGATLPGDENYPQMD